MTTNPVGQFLIKYTIILYYLLASPFTLTHYFSVARVLKGNAQKLPALVLYSTDDPLTVTDRIVGLINHWKTNGVRVRSKAWPKSAHVQHFRLHNEEYVDEVERFLKEELKMPWKQL